MPLLLSPFHTVMKVWLLLPNTFKGILKGMALYQWHESMKSHNGVYGGSIQSTRLYIGAVIAS